MNREQPGALHGLPQRLGFGAPWHEERLCITIAALLAAGAGAEALLLSQRLCAVQRPLGADALVFRAAALALCGEIALALDDIRNALTIDPEHEAALRLLLKHGSGEEQQEARDWLDRAAGGQEADEAIADPASIAPAAARALAPARCW